MSRKNKCRGCVWGTRLNEIQQFCPFGSCVMKGGGNNGNDPPGTADCTDVQPALGALKPPPNLTLSQWADSYRRLSAEASAAQGRWNTDNAPFQREIMDAIGDVHIRKVVAMMCAQSGKTDGLILNTIGYYMSYYPAPIMIVQPTVNLGESFSKDRLAIYNDPLTYADLF